MINNHFKVHGDGGPFCRRRKMLDRKSKKKNGSSGLKICKINTNYY